LNVSLYKQLFINLKSIQKDKLKKKDNYIGIFLKDECKEEKYNRRKTKT
jgi:hypothetical protein